MNSNEISYENDFYTWLTYNAQLLREGRLSEIDTVNIAEELEAMGRSEKRELKNRLAVLLAHLLKWQFQSDKRSRSWELTCIEQRREIIQLLKENPSLKSKISEILLEAYDAATLLAERETGIQYKTFPNNCPFAFEQIMNDNFYPEKA